FFFQAEDGIRDRNVTGVQTCALPISSTGSATGCASRCRARRSSWCRTASVRSDGVGAVLIQDGDAVAADALELLGDLLVELGLRSEERRVGKWRRFRWRSGLWCE